MAEEPRTASSSTDKSTEEKKPQQSNFPQSPTPQIRAGVATAAPPRPTTVPAAAAPAQKRQSPRDNGRRNFAKAIVTVAAILSIAPFVPWGTFLSSSVGSTGAYRRQKVVIDNNTSKYGAAAGKTVNVNNLSTFPPDSHWVITYPSSGDLAQDTQNPDTFVKFELIRLPGGALGGDTKDAAAFVAFSKVCVHLWCSPNYNPAATHEKFECPCHGSIYEVPDGLAVDGPASQQPTPTNAIPMLTLTADSDGTLYIEPPLWDVEHNGVIGYGRNYKSYDTYIKPAGTGSG